MSVYIFRVDHYCEACVVAQGFDPRAAEEWEGDTGEHPVSYPESMIEADYPVHCCECGHFFDRCRLTTDGEEYVRARLASDDGDAEVHDAWAERWPYLLTV